MNSANPSAEPVRSPVQAVSSRGDGSPALNSALPALHQHVGLAEGARGKGFQQALAAGADVSGEARVKRLRTWSAASRRAAASVKRMKTARETR